MRADVNLSVRRAGEKALGTRTEMKNINSIKAIERAIADEADRQIGLLLRGGCVTQETRRWDDDKRESYAMRSKENAQDYRYFPEPDIPVIFVEKEYVEAVRDSLPEFMEEKRERFMRQYSLSEYDAGLLTADRRQAALYEETVGEGAAPKAAANWLIVQLARVMNDLGKDFEEISISSGELAKLINYVEEGKVNRKDGIDVLSEMIQTDGSFDVAQYVQEHGLFITGDSEGLLEAVREVILSNDKAVGEYKGGKEKAIGFLVGQVMRRGSGKFHPVAVREAMEKELKK